MQIAFSNTIKIVKEKGIICLIGKVNHNETYPIKRIDCNEFISNQN